MMELNADFSRRAMVHAAKLAWTPSPVPGVERRMLDRVGDEVARATSLVRYAPNSRFPAHTHGGGEEFFVIEGVFQDEHGDYPAGWYIRNPPTSSHAPGSDTGCLIFVKLWQFDPEDRTQQRIDTGTRSYSPATARPGVELMPLYQDKYETVRLERWAPGAEILLTAAGGLEILVLEGGFDDREGSFEPHSWLRLPDGDALRAEAGPQGCRIWLKTGHLQRILTASPLPTIAASP